VTLHIAIGGGAGALARFAISGWVTTWAGVGFPWGTFAVNLAGSAVLGLLLGRLAQRRLSPQLRAGLTIGFCGGFTTFSTFDYEAYVLLEQGEYGTTVLYFAASVLACVAGVALGLAAAAPKRLEA
jgi:fluoride exporter